MPLSYKLLTSGLLTSGMGVIYNPSGDSKTLGYPKTWLVHNTNSSLSGDFKAYFGGSGAGNRIYSMSLEPNDTVLFEYNLMPIQSGKVIFGQTDVTGHNNINYFIFGADE